VGDPAETEGELNSNSLSSSLFRHWREDAMRGFYVWQICTAFHLLLLFSFYCQTFHQKAEIFRIVKRL
jgi:hypothetical protein